MALLNWGEKFLSLSTISYFLWEIVVASYHSIFLEKHDDIYSSSLITHRFLIKISMINIKFNRRVQPKKSA